MILKGWKDVAKYLGCGVRTVQRWEDWGLPVRRPTKGLRSAVVAITEEIDAWVKRRSPATDDSVSAEANILERLKRGERIDHFETVRMREGGTLLDSLTSSPVRDGEGGVIGASKGARDITEQKRAERGLRESRERLRSFADGLKTEVRLRIRELERRNAEVPDQSEQLRDLSNRLLRSQDDERRRIARELHDSAGQILTALGMNLGNIGRRVRHDSQIYKGVEDSRKLVQQLSKEIRTTSYLLHPPLLDENGLPEAIRWYVHGLERRSDLKIELCISEDFGRLPFEVEMALFRIVQECLTNIHRHSGSKKAKIRIARKPGTVFLAVQDEGKGIPPDKLVSIQGQNAGVGIAGIRERAHHLRGTMNVQSSSSGTTISITVPVPISAVPRGKSKVLPTRAAG